MTSLDEFLGKTDSELLMLRLEPIRRWLLGGASVGNRAAWQLIERIDRLLKTEALRAPQSPAGSGVDASAFATESGPKSFWGTDRSGPLAAPGESVTLAEEDA